MVKVKICGNTSLDDAMAAVEAGADALGFVFYAKSPRAVAPKMAASIIARLPPFAIPVGVFVDEEASVVRQIMADCGIPLAQFHGAESPQYCAEFGRSAVKAIRVRDRRDLEQMASYRVAGFVLDAYVEGVPGGTGHSMDWALAAESRAFGLILLAGGLTPDNVVEAVRLVRPYGVDVSSGVESSPGKKDHAKVRAFVTNAKRVAW